MLIEKFSKNTEKYMGHHNPTAQKQPHLDVDLPIFYSIHM